MIEKNFKNLDEQVEIFKYKGMQINDEKYTKKEDKSYSRYLKDCLTRYGKDIDT